MRLANIPAGTDRQMADYWTDRLHQHHHDTYKGRALVKLPEDMRTYQHVIEDSRPEVIVELGTYDGGSALWFADQLDVLCGVKTARPTVITVDRAIRGRSIQVDDPNIAFIHGDLGDTDVASRVSALVDGRRAMVVEDAEHTDRCTTAALELYSGLVSPGCYFVVEDAIVDDPDLALAGWGGGGVAHAISRFIEHHEEFTQEYLEPYGLTMHFGGWLKHDG
jgi:cephalosporin hydroxylase